MSSLPTIPEAIARLLDQEIDAEIQPEDPRLLISLSGGVDSVALLIATAQWAKRSKRTVQVEAFHMHHGLRGEEADRDARHCLLICRQWEIPLHVVYEPLDRQLGPGQPSLETLCRHKRREHFAKVAKARDCQWVLLGHHTSDQAETVLGNILRGCGLRGLRGGRGVRGLRGLRGSPRAFHSAPGGSPGRPRGNNMLVEKHSGLRVSSPLVSQADLDTARRQRKVIQFCLAAAS